MCLIAVWIFRSFLSFHCCKWCCNVLTVLQLKGNLEIIWKLQSRVVKGIDRNDPVESLTNSSDYCRSGPLSSIPVVLNPYQRFLNHPQRFLKISCLGLTTDILADLVWSRASIFSKASPGVQVCSRVRIPALHQGASGITATQGGILGSYPYSHQQVKWRTWNIPRLFFLVLTAPTYDTLVTS